MTNRLIAGHGAGLDIGNILLAPVRPVGACYLNDLRQAASPLAPLDPQGQRAEEQFATAVMII